MDHERREHPGRGSAGVRRYGFRIESLTQTLKGRIGFLMRPFIIFSKLCIITLYMNIFDDFNITRSEGKLKNGIRVVLYHRPGAPITTTALLKSGSKNDPDSMLGVAHFLEHMIVNGSQEFPTKDLLSEHIESVGGSYDAATWQEYMRVNVEISDKSDYSRVIDIFDSILSGPLMDKKIFENEKQVIIKEIQKNNSNPLKVLFNTVRKLFFKDTPFEHEVLGNESTILKLNYDNVILEYKKLFDKSRITFVTSGDILINELIDYLNNISFLEGNDFPQKDDTFLISSETKILTTFFDAPQTHIYFGIPAPQAYTKESLHLNLLGQILAGGRASRLTKKLRYEKGLVYSVGFSRFGGQQFSSWGILTDTTDNKVQEVIDQKNGVEDSELNFVKNKSIKSLKRNMQTSNDWVDFHAVAEVFVDGKYNINTFVKNTEETTTEDIRRIIDKFFVSDKWQLALCGRTKEESVNINW